MLAYRKIRGSGFGVEIIEFDVQSLHRDRASELRELVECSQFVVIRNQHLSLAEQVALTEKLGQPEPAWEDKHPENDAVQLLSSANKVKLSIKSSSQHWHLDRSFDSSPTRLTILYAKDIQGSVGNTEILNARSILDFLPISIVQELKELKAIHSFSLNFPRIMRLKGKAESEIELLRAAHPDAEHPLIRISKAGDLSLYFNELCTGLVTGVDQQRSDYLIELMINALNKSSDTYVHKWKTGDILIWDNFSTAHRGIPNNGNGVRILHRTTVGDQL